MGFCRWKRARGRSRPICGAACPGPARAARAAVIDRQSSRRSTRYARSYSPPDHPIYYPLNTGLSKAHTHVSHFIWFLSGTLKKKKASRVPDPGRGETAPHSYRSTLLNSIVRLILSHKNGKVSSRCNSRSITEENFISTPILLPPTPISQPIYSILQNRTLRPWSKKHEALFQLHSSVTSGNQQQQTIAGGSIT